MCEVAKGLIGHLHDVPKPWVDDRHEKLGEVRFRSPLILAFSGELLDAARSFRPKEVYTKARERKHG